MWQLVGHESGRHARYQRLAASAQAAEPSRAVHRGPVPLTFSPLGLPGVHSPHAPLEARSAAVAPRLWPAGSQQRR
jgi:hypothetical protein